MKVQHRENIVNNIETKQNKIKNAKSYLTVMMTLGLGVKATFTLEAP